MATLDEEGLSTGTLEAHIHFLVGQCHLAMRACCLLLRPQLFAGAGDIAQPFSYGGKDPVCSDLVAPNSSSPLLGAYSP